MMNYFKNLQKNGVEITGDERLIRYLPQWKFNNAVKAAEENFGFRESDIFGNAKSIEIKSHIYPGDKYITATVFDDETSFDFIIEHQTDGKNGYKPGAIIG